ncbi:MAG: SDR family oxidoreductase [Chitinophagaceae bacterium]
MTHTPSILITGATGNVGSEIARQLSANNIPFRAMVRSIEGAEAIAALKGAELVTGDFNDPESISNALNGIERAFLLTNSSEQAETQQCNFTDAARKAGVQHIVKLSQLAADLHSPVRFLRYHAAVEQKIQASGLAYTFLRPNLFMQGLLGFSYTIATQGKFFAAIGDAPISMIDVRDIAAVAVEALTGEGHEGKTYTITGPEALTHDQLAVQLSKASGSPVQFIPVSPEDMQQGLLAAGFPLWQAEGLIEDYAHYARGEAAAVTTTVQDVTGQPARRFANFAKEYAPFFSMIVAH